MTETKAETMEFQAEVNQLLKLMIHSLYSNKEIFLRELISNASDACDKLRFEAVANDALNEGDQELAITVSFDAEAHTVSISDNGIGMNREEVINNIGTIAKSGTKQFLDALTGDQKEDARLIGQFGVGFYSAFVVADKVSLTTRKAGDDPANGVKWESEATGSYELEQVEVESKGTTVTLHLREDAHEFADNWRLRGIIKKYSDHITFPIMMLEVVHADPEDEEAEKKEPELEKVNDASALWTRGKNDISEDEYKAFYKQVSHDWEDPLDWSHNRVEGKYEYTSLLYIPKKAPFDLYDAQQQQGIKLYAQRVFIMDEADKLMPRYLRFVRGLVDSSDLPLNVSREILQSNKVVESIRTASVKKVLSLLESMASKRPDDYKVFWEQFGRCLKEAPGEDFANKEQVAGLFRFASTNAGTDEQCVGLADYIGRMKPGQDKIYYITADSHSAGKNSPHLEIFKKKDVEVLIMFDRVDEWMMSYLNEFDGKTLSSVAKGDLDLGEIQDKEEKEQQESVEKESEKLIERLKEKLGEQVAEVRVSHRLTTSPACVVLGEQEMAMHMQQLMRQAGHEVPENKPTLEINPTHPIVKKMDVEPDEDRFGDWSKLLLDQAVLAEGGQLDDAAGFVHRLNELIIELSD
ncbi:molecular chaperone HtpG [Chromatiales bacterium (ex Bugula neritina AB1)]|nr:molecular chaperone HtpG [Chromatiales bacterium (ex Bugula neritina AB1)]